MSICAPAGPTGASASQTAAAIDAPRRPPGVEQKLMKGPIIGRFLLFIGRRAHDRITSTLLQSRTAQPKNGSADRPNDGGPRLHCAVLYLLNDQFALPGMIRLHCKSLGQPTAALGPNSAVVLGRQLSGKEMARYVSARFHLLPSDSGRVAEESISTFRVPLSVSAVSSCVPV
jgi:hypothetical protein